MNQDNVPEGERWEILPAHYRDTGGLCEYTGKKALDGICPNGCAGAQHLTYAPINLWPDDLPQ